MRCIGLLSRGEISDGAGNLEHAVISARGPSEARPRFMQWRFARSIGLAQALYLSVGERAVGTVLALYLARISCPNPRGNHSAGFSSWAGASAGTSISRSIRSNKGPESLRW